jgi:alkyl sulfatase BDS1-like metallo-beta-lactamase superfamily hydrolase
MGWYDANPVNLNPLPSEDSACEYVELMGGSEILIEKSQGYYNKGDYRFAAELLNKAVFCDSSNQNASELLAITYEQLGFQSEAGSWRNVYLSGAKELRDGPTQNQIELSNMAGILRNTPVNKFFETLAVRLDSQKAQGLNLSIGVTFTDLDSDYLLIVKNSVLREESLLKSTKLNASISLTHDLFIKILIGQIGAKDLLLSDELKVEGSTFDLLTFLNLFDKPTPNFNIVTP